MVVFVLTVAALVVVLIVRLVVAVLVRVLVLLYVVLILILVISLVLVLSSERIYPMWAKRNTIQTCVCVCGLWDRSHPEAQLNQQRQSQTSSSHLEGDGPERNALEFTSTGPSASAARTRSCAAMATTDRPETDPRREEHARVEPPRIYRTLASRIGRADPRGNGPTYIYSEGGHFLMNRIRSAFGMYTTREYDIFEDGRVWNARLT